MCCVAFYDIYKHFLSGTKQIDGSTATTNQYGKITAIAPENAAYVVFSTHNINEYSNYFGHVRDLQQYVNSLHELYDEVEVIQDDIENNNGIKYTYLATKNIIIQGSYYSASGNVNESETRIRNKGIIHAELDSYIVFLSGETINSISIGTKANGESEFTSQGYSGSAFVKAVNANTDIIVSFYSLVDGEEQDITPLDYDATCYVVSVQALKNYKNQNYANTLEYYAYQDNARIWSEQGTITRTNGWVLSAYIPVLPDDVYIYHSGDADNLAYVAFYNSSKQLLSAYSNEIKPRIIKVPNNAAFMRVSVSKDENGKIIDSFGKTVFAWNAIGQIYSNEGMSISSRKR